VNVEPPSSVPGPTLPPDNPPPNNPPPPPTSGTVPPHSTYTVKRGDTLSSIAKKYKTSWQTIWNFNLKYRSPATIATLKARGPNLIFAGQTFWIPT
jgi:nucleoid-associated protein YgaU